MRCLFVFGLGYVGTAVALTAHAQGWKVMGSSRTGHFNAEVTSLYGKEDLKNIKIFCFDEDSVLSSLLQQNVSHVLITMPPVHGQDLVFQRYGPILQRVSPLKWLGYISATSVYGDHQGAWIDESAACHPSEDRGRSRLAVEQQWQQFTRAVSIDILLFRLSSIYGPCRSTLSSLKKGNIHQRVVKEDQVFSRIHLADIVQILMASMNKNLNSGVYNVSDDFPCAPQDIIEEGCRLLNYPLPPLVIYKNADMSLRARSFYRDNRRISNTKIKKALGIELQYSSYKEGLTALFHQNAF